MIRLSKTIVKHWFCGQLARKTECTGKVILSNDRERPNEARTQFRLEDGRHYIISRFISIKKDLFSDFIRINIFSALASVCSSFLSWLAAIASRSCRKMLKHGEKLSHLFLHRGTADFGKLFSRTSPTKPRTT